MSGHFLGTHLISAIVWMIKHDGDPQCLMNGMLDHIDRVPYAEEWSFAEKNKRNIDLLMERKPPRTFFTHLGFDGLPEQIKQKAKVSIL